MSNFLSVFLLTSCCCLNKSMAREDGGLLEQQIGRPLIKFPCRHHILELVLRAAFEEKLESTSAPVVLIFKRFKDEWGEMDHKAYTTAVDDEKINIAEVSSTIAQFCKLQLEMKHNRADYGELLRLVLILLGMPEEKRILCVGMCVLDIVHVCADYPKEDTDKRCQNGYWQRGGNASNNCTVLRKLGAKCEFLGMTSSSPAFGFLYEDCRERQIQIDNCPKTNKDPPFSSIILVESKGSRTIIHSNSGFPILTHQHFKAIDLSPYTWIHFEGRNPEETQEMMNIIRRYNKSVERPIKISVELEKLNNDLFALAMRADVVFIAKDMAEYQGWSSAREAVYLAREVINQMQSKEKLLDTSEWTSPCVICPWGSEGSDCITSSGEYASFPAVKVSKVVDSLGAGDTFVAGFIYAMQYLKMTAPQAVNYANQTAAFKIQHKGYDAMDQFQPRK